MTIKNAIKKLERNGFAVEKNSHQFVADNPEHAYTISFCQNGRSEDITCINVRRRGEKDDIMTDYFAGIYCDNITQAIRLATR